MLAVMPGTLVAAAGTVVAVAVALDALAGTVVAVSRTVVAMARTVVVMPMPGAVVAVMAVVSEVVVSGTEMAVAAVVVRNEDEGVRGKTVPVTVSAVPATGMLPMTVMSGSARFVQHPVEGSRGNSEENHLAGREGMAVPATVALSLFGERRLDAESEHCKQGSDQGR